MKGIILHGGHGTRLRPLTHTGPKQLLPIANKPMSEYCVEAIRDCGISEIAIIVGGIGSNKVREYYGNGSNIRDWIYVEDHCDAVSLALFNGKRGESYNISANNEVNNLTIVKKILSILDKSEDLLEFVEDRPGHDFRYSMNSNKISSELGWKTKLSFDKGLEKTIQWYLENPEIMNNVSPSTLDSTPWKSSN